MKYRLNELIHAKGITQTVQEAVMALRHENEELRAKIEAMERQETHSEWFSWLPEGTTHIDKLDCYLIPHYGFKAYFKAFKYVDGVLYSYRTDSDNEYGQWIRAKPLYKEGRVPAVYPLYALPGAQPAPKKGAALAYTDPEASADENSLHIVSSLMAGRAYNSICKMIGGRWTDAKIQEEAPEAHDFFTAMFTPSESAPSIPEGWLRAIDEALVVAHIGVANADDTYEQAKSKLDNLIGFHVDVTTDPAVNGGWKLVPTAESRHPGIYKMLSVLHAVDNTPGASEWESYAAFLAAAPESKVEPIMSSLNLSDPAVQKRLAAQWGYVPAPSVPTGWKLVPIELTEEMTVAGVRAGAVYYAISKDVWGAMLAAAPEAKP